MDQDQATVALLADRDVAPRLTHWLRQRSATAAGYEVVDVSEMAGRGLLPRPARTLISYFPDPDQTREVISPLLEARVLPAGAVWLQLGPMELPRAYGFAMQARAAELQLWHAPYLQTPDPLADEPPMAVVWGPISVTSRGRVDGLVRALTSQAAWCGPLENALETPTAFSHEAGFEGLADAALTRLDPPPPRE
ncbi:hypothetical protein [Streptomyces nanshensis]|uniref:Uncharacterized protein n=1 Tax=Streptomyces nanshensis TaxID=518642 RepID=A0A1E7KZD8_9ACTN|nr:hypothetical protein [Streptomyces nanshensis]OEV09296.1 hypothetical protein AN218_22920 [Streptomyces nanshensis]